MQSCVEKKETGENTWIKRNRQIQNVFKMQTAGDDILMLLRIILNTKIMSINYFFIKWRSKTRLIIHYKLCSILTTQIFTFTPGIRLFRYQSHLLAPPSHLRNHGQVWLRMAVLCLLTSVQLLLSQSKETFDLSQELKIKIVIKKY